MLVLLCALALPWAVGLRADTLILASGTRIAGSVVSVSQGAVVFKDSVGTSRRYRADEVVAIEFAPPGLKSNAAILALPAETALKVRLLEMIDSSLAAAGQTYAALLDADFSDSGAVVLPKGSSVRIAIREAGASSRNAPPALTLEIQSLTVRGRQYRFTVPSLAGSGAEGEPVKRPAFSSDFSSARQSSAGPVIRIVAGASSVVIASVADNEGVPGVERLAGGHMRVPADTALTFAATGPVTLQASR